MTKEDIIRMAHEAGWMHDHDSETGFVAEAAIKFAALVAALVAAAERERIAQMIEDAPPLVQFVTNDHGGCLMCGFTPKLAASSIRAKQ